MDLAAVTRRAFHQEMVAARNRRLRELRAAVVFWAGPLTVYALVATALVLAARWWAW